MTETTDQAPLPTVTPVSMSKRPTHLSIKLAVWVKSTHEGINVINKTAYAGMVKPDLSGMDNPLIAATCDGVGTKLIVARDANHFSGLGQDLVAMNVNDSLLPAAARPLLFLDYLATGKLDPEQLEIIVASVAKVLPRERMRSLAEKPQRCLTSTPRAILTFAGFAVGIADEDRVPTPANMAAGDIVLGCHRMEYTATAYPLLGERFLTALATPPKPRSTASKRTWVKTVLAPTALYVKPVMAPLEDFTFTGAAHITGVVLLGRSLKLVQNGLGMTIDPSTYSRPPIFKVIQEAGNITDHEMASTFNMGIGFIVIVKPEDADKIQKAFPNTWMRVGHLHNDFEGVDSGYARS